MSGGWIDRKEALARLGVRAQTLYAYVSRGRIGVRPDPDDPRRSLYASADIDAFATRRARGRKAGAIAASAIAWGEPALTTRISTIAGGRLIYRGEDAIRLSRQASIEDVAALLWEQPRPPTFADDGAVGFASPLAAMAGLAGDSLTSLGRPPAQLAGDGARAIARLAAGFGLPAGDAPLHDRLARLWGADSDAGDVIRQALVLMADHELNASTFAVRVAASTGASIAACLIAGLATLSGPRHGGAGAALNMLVAQAQGQGIRAALDHWLALGSALGLAQAQALPGFGHPLYPAGDARALALLGRLAPDPALAHLRDAAMAATDQAPNIDFALCALARSLGLPADAPFVLFALGRSVGWVAHAMEQGTAGALIRPRGRYEGAMPVEGDVEGDEAVSAEKPDLRR